MLLSTMKTKREISALQKNFLTSSTSLASSNPLSNPLLFFMAINYFISLISSPTNAQSNNPYYAGITDSVTSQNTGPAYPSNYKVS